MSEPSGFLNIHKPLGITSHDVVAKIRRTFKLKKVGHVGTLDPLATGVLIVCVGQATRLSEYVMHATKRYLARVHLGVTTDTYDVEGQVLTNIAADHITLSQLEACLPTYLGTIQQVPPAYSAIKRDGRKLYDLARAGEVVVLEPRTVQIHSLQITEWQPPHFSLDVTCSAGTYIRSLAHDLGQQLGVGAHLAGLVRIASGSFDIADSIPLDELLDHPGWHTYITPPHSALSTFSAVTLTDDHLQELRFGRSVPIMELSLSDPIMAYDASRNLVAVLQTEGGQWRPHKVFL
jgi:tRNA pseudouridine55 synthase